MNLKTAIKQVYEELCNCGKCCYMNKMLGLQFYMDISNGICPICEKYISGVDEEIE